MPARSFEVQASDRYSVDRRRFLGRVLGAGCGVAALTPAAVMAPSQPAAAEAWTPAMPGSGFGFSQVSEKARQLAGNAYQPDPYEVPEQLAQLSPDKYHTIRFHPEATLWRGTGSRFQVQFFPRGSFFRRGTSINVVDGDETTPVPYDSGMFDFGPLELEGPAPPDLGFAGFRLLYPLNREDRFDEVGSFLGASYFRLVAAGQHYGLSARAVAVDTGLAKTEEFPYFREFWLRKPRAESRSIEIYALLDSESLAGAYHFVLTPGTETVMQVRAELYTRAAVEKLGLSPLTSMFFYGENTTRNVDDLRPEVHDSDGALLATGAGEWIWRPLTNRRELQISSFADESPRGFGLLQRDRDPGHYLDLNFNYERRPSAWVEPDGAWGRGTTQLIEIPTDSERHDNIVCFWVPERPMEPGQVWSYAYRLRIANSFPDLTAAGKALATREAAADGQELRRFGIEFGGGALADLAADQEVQLVVSASAGRVHNARTRPYAGNSIWHSVFDLDPEGEDAIELRAFLKDRDHALTETWSYLWKRN